MTGRRTLLLLSAVLVALEFALPAASRQAQRDLIVFESNRTGNSDVWIANADGTGQRDLTADSTVDDSSPALSPDGKQIVYVRAHGNSTGLWLMNTDGSGNRPLGTPQGSESHPAWSANSDMIAFVRLLNGQWDVAVSNLQGERRLLTNDAAPQYDVSWSPKGDRIVFDQLENGSSDLWTVPAAGGKPTRLTKTPGIAELNPAWSPVGNQVAYDAANAQGQYDLYVLDLSTHATRRITNDAADDGDPAWSPDGKMLVYRRGVGAADYEIAKVDTTGKGKPVDVSNDPNALDVSPSWRTSTAAFRTPASARRPAILGVWNFFCDAAYTGTAANDFYTGTTSWNHMCGAGGSDTISGCGSPSGTADFIRGDAGTDHLYGYIAPKAICLVAADRTDWLKSRYAGPVAADKDYLYGGPGSDHALIDANDVAAADIEDVQT